jgi:hypothetical protein
MAPYEKKWKRTASCLPFAVALIGLASAGCSEIRPEPDVEQGGVLEAPTHEADALRRAEQRQEQNRGGSRGGMSGGGGGGGGGY